MELRNASALRVEQILKLVPRVDLLAPLRGLLVAVSAPDARSAWSGAASYLTLGKRYVDLPGFAPQVDALQQRIAEHVAAQYRTALTTLDRFQQGDAHGAATELLDAGQREERAGRPAAARAWYVVALDLAEGLSDRRPEIRALLLLGAMAQRDGAFADAAHRHQRALALAEAEEEEASTADACLALGDIALALRKFAGARSWYTRGMRRAQSKDDEPLTGRFLVHLARAALRDGAAREAHDLLRQARARFRADADAADLADLLRVQGEVHEASRDAPAAADYREALMWALRAGDPDLELSIRLHLARLHLLERHGLEAEEEMRRAEQRALAEARPAWLVRIYVRMGLARCDARDENGFVFFEQALELCRAVELGALLEAGTYRAYGDYREALGERDTAHACFERAADVLDRDGTPIDPSVLAASMLG